MRSFAHNKEQGTGRRLDEDVAGDNRAILIVCPTMVVGSIQVGP